MKQWNNEAGEKYYEESEVSWTYNTNLTEWNGQLEVEAGKKTADWTNLIGNCAKTFFDETLDRCRDNISGDDCNLVDETDCEDCGDRKARQAWTAVKQYRYVPFYMFPYTNMNSKGLLI